LLPATLELNKTQISDLYVCATVFCCIRRAKVQHLGVSGAAATARANADDIRGTLHGTVDGEGQRVGNQCNRDRVNAATPRVCNLVEFFVRRRSIRYVYLATIPSEVDLRETFGCARSTHVEDVCEVAEDWATRFHIKSQRPVSRHCDGEECLIGDRRDPRAPPARSCRRRRWRRRRR